MDSTLAKGLAVLDWMAREQKECRVTDVAQALSLPRSNAHRTLQTLVECGWVVRNPLNSTYRASLKLFELGGLVEEVVDLKALLHPHLRGLAQASGETIHLAVLQGRDIVYLDKFDSPLPVSAYSRIGGRAPAYCVASGKAILSALHLDAQALADQVGDMQPHTPNTITDLDALQVELQRTAARGWAENREEWRVGVCGLGAPIFNARAEVVAAIGMSVPSIRFARSKASALANSVMACARDASITLGFHPVSRSISSPGSSVSSASSARHASTAIKTKRRPL